MKSKEKIKATAPDDPFNCVSLKRRRASDSWPPGNIEDAQPDNGGEPLNPNCEQFSQKLKNKGEKTMNDKPLIRIALEDYIGCDITDSPDIFKIHIADYFGGTMITSGLLTNINPKEVAISSFYTPSYRSGVYMKLYQPKTKILVLGILSGLNSFELLCNDSYAAREQAARFVFGSHGEFAKRNNSIEIHEGWTEEPHLLLPFLMELDMAYNEGTAEQTAE
jgi:hypothetical protein